MDHNVILIPPESEAEVLQRQYGKAKLEGNITGNGVVYKWWLESRSGAGFKLFRERNHMDHHLQEAEDELRRTRDVVVLDTVAIEALPEASYHLHPSKIVQSENGPEP